ncbi:GNAT family N-acetyltransferase [Morganella psychrotolerans]|uniref:GNAT family N-acetyltransferase n=1 Tax=Morganella psychrotolerans TaxID=368603 RepID=UPI0039AF9F53
MRMLKKYLGWNKCSYSEYERIALKFGYNAETSPHYISFALKHGAELDFYLYVKKNEELGAVCVDNGWLCNDIKNDNSKYKGLILPKYSIMPPFKDGIICAIPFKSKCLASRNVKIINSSYKVFSKRNVALCKSPQEFSKKTISTREREIRKFIQSGGSFKSFSELDSVDLYDIYHSLYSKRRNLEFYESPSLREFFDLYKDNFKGSVAYIEGEPVSIQLNLLTKSKYGNFMDFLNIGYNTDVKCHSLGNIIMWKNLIDYSQDIDCENLIYSYGMMSGDYKNRWCTPQKVARIII